MEKFVKLHQVNLFLAGLGHLEPPLSKKGEKPRGCIEVTQELLRGLKKRHLKVTTPQD